MENAKKSTGMIVVITILIILLMFCTSIFMMKINSGQIIATVVKNNSIAERINIDNIKDPKIVVLQNGWRSQDIDVSIYFPALIDTIREYSYDGINWKRTLSNPIRLVVNSNSVIYARYSDTKTGEVKISSCEISNIDKLSPNDFTIALNEVKRDSFVVNVEDLGDANKNEKYEQSGIYKYEYYLDGRLKYSGTNTKCKFDNVNYDAPHRIYVIVYDRTKINFTCSNIIKLPSEWLNIGEIENQE